MPFKGFNSILFDMDSVIDKEISVLRFISIDYINKGHNLQWLNKEVLDSWTSMKDLTHKRMHGDEDLFKSIIKPEFQNMKEKYYELMDDIWCRDSGSILQEDLIVFTDMIDLIKAYTKAGNGIISTAVRVNTEREAEFIETNIPETECIIRDPKQVDMDLYGRLIVGSFRTIPLYKFNQPKSLVVLNYRDNFCEENSELLRPELIINFGDIHDISVAPAYRENL